MCMWELKYLTFFPNHLICNFNLICYIIGKTKVRLLKVFAAIACLIEKSKKASSQFIL